VRKFREENHDTTALLPPSLALPKEVAELPERLAKIRTEHEVRAIVEDINERILDVHRKPQVGPLDVDEIISERRTGQTA
jgi:hypothetical protein